MHAVLGTLFTVGLLAVGWGAWTANTTTLQVTVLAALAVCILGDRWSNIPFPGLVQGGFTFVAGGGIGALAYFQEVSILLGAMWIVLFAWIEKEFRDEVSVAFDAVGEWFDT
jgi:hypothetical protein